jgi:hypothetical protein
MYAVSDSIVILGGALNPIQETQYYAAYPTRLLKSTPADFLRSLYSYRDSMNISRYFDVLSYHPYGPFWGDDASDSLCIDPLYYRYVDGEIGDTYSFMVTEKLYDIMCEHDDSDKQIWGTECGPAIEPESENSCVNLEMQGYWADRYLQQWTAWDFTGPLLWWNVRSPGWPWNTYSGWGAMDSLWTPRPAYLIWEEWGNGEFHIGEGPDFLHHDLDDALATRVWHVARESNTIRLVFHAKDDPYYGSLALLDLESLPASAALEHLEIIGVGSDRSSTEPAAPGAVVLDALVDRSHLRLNGRVGLTLRDITVQHVYNSDTPREGDPDPVVSSFIRSEGGAVHLENCAFIDITTVGSGDVDPGGVLTYAAPEGVSGFVTVKSCLFVDCAGREAGVADVTRSHAVFESCTIHHSTSSGGGSRSLHFTSGSLNLLGCLFTGSADAADASYQLESGSSAQVSYSLFDAGNWAAGQPAISGGAGNLISTPSEALETVAYVDPVAGDFRLRWNSACLDIGDPDPTKRDFDLTRSDIGWSPAYPVVEISGTAVIAEPGNYLVTGTATPVSGPNLVIPSGTTMRLAENSTLLVQDIYPADGRSVTVGDPDGARTAIVGPPAYGAIQFGVEGTGVTPVNCQFHGVLFNHLPSSAYLQFHNCIVDLNGANGNVVFNDSGTVEPQFHEVCRGSFRNFDFSAPQIEDGIPGIGSLSMFHSDIDLLNVQFDAVPAGGYWKIWQSGVAPGNGQQVIAGCTIPCTDNTYGVYPLFATDAVLTLHHNEFTDIQQGVVYMYASTLDMADGAVNSFDKPDVPEFNGNSVIIGWGAPVDLHCGYNSIIYGSVQQIDLFIEAPCFTGDWRSNYWGRDCEIAIDPGDFLPACVTNYTPTLSACPSQVVPCNDQTGDELALYELGAEADAQHNYVAACAYWTEMMVEFPASKHCTKVTACIKAIGLVTDYGAEAYALIRADLEAAAAASEPVDLLLSVTQRCAAWCVEARHGDRPAALALLAALLAELQGNKDAEMLINAAIAEIGTYPESGGMSAANPGMSVARLDVQAQQLRAYRLALLPEETRARIAREGMDEDGQAPQPVDFRLLGCHPNPFNPVTTIELACRGDAPLRLEVFDLLGRRVATLHDGPILAGRHVFRWDAASRASGLYVVRAVQVGRQEVAKVMLIR